MKDTPSKWESKSGGGRELHAIANCENVVNMPRLNLLVKNYRGELRFAKEFR